MKSVAASDTYPYAGNDSLTNSSTPAATLHNANSSGSKLMNCSIMNIKENSDGSMSFVFRVPAKNGGNSTPSGPTGIKNVGITPKSGHRVYSISGTYLGTDLEKLPHGIYIIDGKKVVK